MPLIWDDDLVRLELQSDPGVWVDLKRRFTAGDEEAILRVMMPLRAELHQDQREITAETITADIELARFNMERVRRSIVAWSFTHNGTAVPVDDGMVRRLAPETFAEIRAKVDELNPFGPSATMNGNGRATSPGSRDTAAGRRRR